MRRGIQRQFRPNFIENTFYAIQSTYRSLEMQSKQRYEICIYSVIVSWVISKLQGLQYYFLERFTKVRNFFISVSITFSNPKILGFLRKIVIGRNRSCESLQTAVQPVSGWRRASKVLVRSLNRLLQGFSWLHHSSRYLIFFRLQLGLWSMFLRKTK